MNYKISGISNKSVNSKRTNGSISSFAKFKHFRATEGHKSVSNSKNLSESKKGFSWPKFRKKLFKVFMILLALGTVVMIVGLIALGIYLKQIQSHLPNPEKLVDRKLDESTVITDRNGTELFKIYGDENREFVKLSDIPEQTKWAMLAAEDIDFYEHKGADIKGIARAIYINITKKGSSGASTITQQLVRNTLLYDLIGKDAYKASYTRKIQEILITMQVEQTLSKDEILQMYMNEVFLGGVNYGFEAGAKAYFGKDVKDLDLAQSALLAGLVQSPSTYSPLYGTNPELAKKRQEIVLDLMLKYKDKTGVTQEQIDAAKSEELVYQQGIIDIKAPHFVFYIKKQLEDEFGVDQVARGGLKVTTTLDYSLQEIAQDEITQGVPLYGDVYGVKNGAMVVLDPHTNQLLAMVGSIDYNKTDDPRVDGNVNVTTAPRQMGSSFKPYTYLAAFEKGYGPWLETPDVPNMNWGYQAQNWDGQNYGPMTARQALLTSRNFPALYTIQMVGVDAAINIAERAGITTLTDRDSYGLSLTLGAAEMTLLEHSSGYTTFATGGIKRPLTTILKVEDSKGNVLKEYQPSDGERVFDEKDVYMLNWILCDMGNFQDQPNNSRYLINGTRAFCGKTGTTDGPKDLTAIMYNANLLVGVWTGNNNNVETPGAWSTTVPMPIASDFMKRVVDRYPPEMFNRPAGVLSGVVCSETGRAPGKDTNCTKVPTVYKAGNPPPPDNREKIKVCKDGGGLSTNLVAADKYGVLEEKTVLTDFKLENPLQEGPYENFMTSRLGFLFKKPDPQECKLPLGKDNAPIVEIKAPTSGATFQSGTNITISAEARAMGNVKSVEFFFDGTAISGGLVTKAPYTITYTVPANVSAGSHTIKAVAIDDVNKTGQDSITITVTKPSPTVAISSPSNGGTITTFPVVLTAAVSNGSLTSLSFEITKSDNSYSKSIVAIASGGNWSASWVDEVGITNGTYTIVAHGFQGSMAIDSPPITVTVSKTIP